MIWRASTTRSCQSIKCNRRVVEQDEERREDNSIFLLILSHLPRRLGGCICIDGSISCSIRRIYYIDAMSFKSINPATEEVIAEYSEHSERRVEKRLRAIQ